MNNQIHALEERIRILEQEVNNYRQVSEHSLEWSVLRSENGREYFVSPSCFYITGYSPEEFLADPELFTKIIFNDDLNPVKEKSDRYRSEDENTMQIEFRILTKDGMTKWIEHHCFKKRNAEGVFICFHGVYSDITERKKSEEALRFSEEKFQKAFHQNPCLVGISTMDTGEYVEVNHSFYDTLGFSPEEVIGKRAADLFKDYTSKRDKFISKIMSQGFIKNEEVVINKKDSTDVIVSLAAEVLRLKDKDHLLVSAFDITELRQTRNDLIYYSGLLEILMDISTNYINLPILQIDKGLNEALKKVGNFVAADRAYLFVYDLEKQTATCTHEWCNEGVVCQKEMFQRVSLEFFADYNSHRHGKVFHVPDVDQLADDRFGRILLSLGIKSLITIPLMDGEECIGFVGFDSVSTPHNFSEREQAIFDLFSKVLVNISLREKDHKELVLSNQRFNAIYENAPIFLAALDKNDNAVLWNKHCERTFGYTLEELQLASDPLKLLFPDPEIRNAVYKVATQSPIGEFVTWYPFTKNGEQLITNWLNFALPDGMIINLGYDITSQRQAEEKFQESEARYKMLFENMNEGFMLCEIICDENGLPVDWKYLLRNPAFEKHTGMKIDHAEGKRIKEIIPDFSPALIQLYGKVALTGEPIKAEDYEHNTQRYYEVSVFSPKRGQFAVLGQDITERKKLQTALFESEKKYRQLVELANEGIWAIDAEAKTTYVNPFMAEMLGYEVEEMIGKPLLAFMTEKNIEIAKNNLERRNQGISEQHDFEFVCKDGKLKFAIINTSPIYNEAGSYIGALALISDITRRKKAEQELLQIIERFNLLSENSRTVYWEVDKQGMCTYVSEGCRSVYGYEPEEIVSTKHFFDICPDWYRHGFIETAFEIFDRAEQFKSFENPIQKKDGQIIWVLTNGLPIFDVDGNLIGYRGSDTDITIEKNQKDLLSTNFREIKQYQSRLQNLNAQLIELEEVERSKIAEFLHDDLGQILAIIHIKLTALLVNENYKSNLEEAINSTAGLLNTAIDECRKLTYELNPPILKEHGLIEALEWKLNEVKKHTQIAIRIDSYSEHLDYEPKQKILLYRIISELINNAVKHSGCSKIWIEIRPLDEKNIFSVHDDGVGFHYDPKDHDFEKHTFGLFNINERLLAFSGQLNVESAPGKGTKVSVVI